MSIFLERVMNLNADKLCVEASEKYYHPILRYCLTLLSGDLPAAEDCTQDVFVLMLEKKDSLDFQHNIRGWLYAAAERICKDYRKREARRLSHISGDLNTAEDVPAPAAFSDSDSVFDVLTTEEYQLLIAYYSEDYGKRRQLAASYQMTPAQLTKKIHSIRQKLGKEAKHEQDDNE